MFNTKQQNESDLDVPPSERGKGENMHLDERSPDSVFTIVGLTYFVVLLLTVLGFAWWMYR